jgi:hypothetical protein
MLFINDARVRLSTLLGRMFFADTSPALLLCNLGTRLMEKMASLLSATALCRTSYFRTKQCGWRVGAIPRR